MAAGGRILAAALDHGQSLVRAGASTGEIDEGIEAFIRGHDGAVPAFKGLYGFPGAACLSVNQEIVHGIPSRKRVLAEGDIITLDIGVKYQGYYTDAARTVPVGPVDETTTKLLAVTEQSLAAGIEAAR